MLTAFGPFVTDMYLPGLPSMVPFFKTTIAKVQLGLTTSMIGMALGQLIFVQLSDKFGRRSPLIGAMFLFVVSTVACIFSPTIEIFIVLRLFQGIAGAGGIVISRSVATDLYSGKELVKIVALIVAINGIAPIVSPVFGGLIINHTSWRGIFILLLIVGIVLFAACIYFRETYPSIKRLNKKLPHAFLTFKPVLQNRNYRLYVFNQYSHYPFFSRIFRPPLLSSKNITDSHHWLSDCGLG